MDTLVTYALLSTIKEKHENVGDILSIYKELTESVLAELNSIAKGKGLFNDLKEAFDTKYNLPIPYPTLKLILTSISKERKDFQLFKTDFSFIHDPKSFPNLNNEIERTIDEIGEVKTVYNRLCEEEHIEDFIGIDFFIKFNRRELISYLNNTPVEIKNMKEFEVFKTVYNIDNYKNVINKMIMGSILSIYTEFDFAAQIKKKILLLDTNFVISLLDLHSIESNITCKEIIRIAKKLKFSIEILPDTIKETKNLLHRKSRYLDKSSIFSNLDDHTIESGCFRKGLGGSDLELISARIEKILKSEGVIVLPNGLNEKYRTNYKKTEIYEKLKDRKYNTDGIQHDVIAMNYIKDQRVEDIDNSFSNTSAFFVTDTQGFIENKISLETQLPYIITADELLNIFWLLNPGSYSVMSSTNISNLFTKFIRNNLPDKKMLNALDRKIQALKEYGVDIDDCAEIAVYITVNDTKKISDLINADEFDSKEKFRILVAAAKENKEKELLRATELSNKCQEIYFSEKKKEKEKTEQIKLALTYEQMKNKEKEVQIFSMQQELKDKVKETEYEGSMKSLRERVELLKGYQHRDEDEYKNLQEEIDEIKIGLDKGEKNIGIILYIIIVIIIITIGITYIIPNWDFFEAESYILGIISAVTIIFAKNIFPLIGIDKVIQIINVKIQNKRILKMHKIENRKNIIYERIVETKNELRHIVL